MTSSFARRFLLAALLVTLAGSGTALAVGDKHANGNPTGEPGDDTQQNPYMAKQDSRTLIFCAEDEMLVMESIDAATAEAVCLPGDQ